MKKTIFKLLFITALVVLFVAPVKAQSPDGSVMLTKTFYKDSLTSVTTVSQNKSARDTVDYYFRSHVTYNYYSITAWSTATDTLYVSVLSADEATYVPTSLYDSFEDESVQMIISTTTPKEYFINAVNPYTIRIRCADFAYKSYVIVAQKGEVR